MRTILGLTAAMCGVGCADHKVGVYNTPPELTILSPEAGASFEEGALIELDAMVRDSQDDSDELSVSWSSSWMDFWATIRRVKAVRCIWGSLN